MPVKKPNGNAVTSFKQNGVYSLTYYNSVFILASGGVDDVNFTSDKLLTGYSANDSNGEKVNGTMPNKGTSTNTLGLNGSLTLPKGYYDSIKVTQSVTTKGSTTDAISQGHSGDYIYTRIPKGAYFTNASSGYPEIKSKFKDIANAIGLTADKIVVGNTIGGITGTASCAATGTIEDTTLQTTVNLGFKPSFILMYWGTNDPSANYTYFHYLIGNEQAFIQVNSSDGLRKFITWTTLTNTGFNLTSSFENSRIKKWRYLAVK